ncbi:hypothetical protein [Flavobacterium sp. ABG]|jgi:hypothetical protein|nr:hypothetical protein [Flavobacterium sp. ABG]
MARFICRTFNVPYLKQKIMKLSLDALKNRAEAVASQELLETISGGVQEACHDVKVVAAE